MSFISSGNCRKFSQSLHATGANDWQIVQTLVICMLPRSETGVKGVVERLEDKGRPTANFSIFTLVKKNKPPLTSMCDRMKYNTRCFHRHTQFQIVISRFTLIIKASEETDF